MVPLKVEVHHTFRGLFCASIFPVSPHRADLSHSEKKNYPWLRLTFRGQPPQPHPMTRRVRLLTTRLQPSLSQNQSHSFEGLGGHSER
jgi:hypothetical protein